MITEQYTLLVKFIAKTGKERELRNSLLELVSETLKEEGCLNFDLHESLTDSRQFMIYENWVNKDFHAKHNESPHVLNWRKNCYQFLDVPTDKSIWKYLKNLSLTK